MVERKPMSELKRRRLAMGLTLRDLAEKIGCSYACISYWENGDRIPTPKNVPKAAQALGMSPKQFLALFK